MSSFPLIFLFISEVLTIISAGALILIFIIKRQSRTFGYRLILPLFVFDFITSLNFVIPTIFLLIDSEAVIYPGLCKVQGFIKLYSAIGSSFATMNIIWSLYTFIIRKKPIKTHNPIEYFAVFNIFIPLAISIIPLFFDRYGPVEPFSNMLCTLSLKSENGETDYIGIILRFTLYYNIVMICFAFDLYSVIRILYHIHNNQNESHDKKYIKNIMLYPLVYFISWVCVIIQRISESFNNEINWINDIDLSLVNLNGFLNAIVYGYVSLNANQYVNQKEDTSETIINEESQLIINSY